MELMKRIEINIDLNDLYEDMESEGEVAVEKFRPIFEEADVTTHDIIEAFMIGLIDEKMKMVYLYKNRVDGHTGLVSDRTYEEYVKEFENLSLMKLEAKRREPFTISEVEGPLPITDEDVGLQLNSILSPFEDVIQFMFEPMTQQVEEKEPVKTFGEFRPLKPKFPKHYKHMMDKAVRTAEEAYCKRLKVGAIFSRDGRALIDGYNGTIAGQPNVCEEEVKSETKTYKFFHDIAQPAYDQFEMYEEYARKWCDENGVVFEDITYNSTPGGVTEKIVSYHEVTVRTSPFTVHAEQNLVQYAAKKGIPLEDGEVFITHAPCPECSKLMVGAGVKTVIFKDHYRDTHGIDFLKQCGVEVIHFPG